ncbi:uncharacterized protein BHQ10_003289 [Talaromyces amestolkiae]|uniref:F-box domain-containing protein n=1 Tax=Talaromyces amestolkiae TaxID=1196081 RepID=A0A364KUP4_TALAM|nr:uncharacterized protein BHQ10_003289 [Talaromyces amestolkiae]RAO67277.1 hypothetical protein BHQ10_003289 [Talaromyces amestolkiae]
MAPGQGQKRPQYQSRRGGRRNYQQKSHQTSPRESKTQHNSGMESNKKPNAQSAPQTRSLSALQMILNFTKEWSPELHHNHQPFTKLPGDVALCIMDHLKDPVDKMSLALTTKSMWEWSQKVLKLQDFKLQQVLPIRASERRGTVKPWPYFRSYRWRLIERLEDEHWKACSGCLRLHPKTEFFTSELKEPANERYCRAPGLIQICPHLLLTYKKCETLQKVLASQAEENKVRKQDTDFDKYLYHECVRGAEYTKEAGHFKLIIGTQPFVTDSKQQLVFRQRYTLHINSESMKKDLNQIGTRSLFPNLCPHRSIATHCLDMLDKQGPWNNDKIVKDDAGDNVTCKGCGTYFSGFKRYVHSTSKMCRIDFFTSKILSKKDFELRDCLTGHGIADELQSWIDKTQLANIVDVTDSVHYGCKCLKKCRKLGFIPISCPSGRASLPDTSWKGDEPVWPY